MGSGSSGSVVGVSDRVLDRRRDFLGRFDSFGVDWVDLDLDSLSTGAERRYCSSVAVRNTVVEVTGLDRGVLPEELEELSPLGLWS